MILGFAAPGQTPSPVAGDDTPLPVGTGGPGSLVTIVVAGTPLTAEVGADGTWRIPIGTVLPKCPLALTATATDLAGHVSQPTLDVWQAHVDADTHHETYGWCEGGAPNAYFQTREYLSENADVAAAGINPLEHYAQYGEQEGRSLSHDFAPESYLAVNGDVKAAGVNALDHYLQYGLAEGCSVLKGEGEPGQFGNFDAGFHLDLNDDVAAAVAHVGPNGIVASEYAFRHYLEYEAREGRAPNALFDPAAYLATNPDVAAAGVNPLLHFIEYGFQEGRLPT